MNFERQMKKRGNDRLNQLTPHLYEKPKKELPKWAKIFIPVGSVATASVVVLAVVLSNVLGPKARLNQIVTPIAKKVTHTINRNMSELTYDSYSAFAHKFVSTMMDANNSKNEDSLGISIPDAYLCLAIVGAISTDEARADILNYLELPDMDALRTATKEVVSTLGTLSTNRQGKYIGGYNLNSIWFNPEKVKLIEEKDEQLYKDLAEVFDASLFMEALTDQKANQYFKNKNNILRNMPAPKIEGLDPSAAIDVMSIYYCLDYFDSDSITMYESQFKSGKHKMDYTSNDKNEKVDYIQERAVQNVYVGDSFYGSSLGVGNLIMDFFLPNDKSALPSSILDDVLTKNYHLKETTYIEYEYDYDKGEYYKAEKPTTLHLVDISAPYFSLDNSSELDKKELQKFLPIATYDGVGKRIAYPIDPVTMFLDSIKQFSTMKFNYSGFYSCSGTIAQVVPGAMPEPEYEYFELKLNHPYVFEVTKTLKVNGEEINVPMVVGEIVTPTYED